MGAHTLRWLEVGKAGPPLVLLHGLSGSWRWWRRSIDTLATRFRLLIPDLVGFGASRTRRPVPPLPDLAADLAEWIQARETGAVHLVGHSMGGQLAVHIAAERPELLRRLVLVDPSGLPRVTGPVSALRFLWDIAPIWRWGDLRFLPVVMGDALRAGPTALSSAARRIVEDDVRPLLPRIRARTLIVWGDLDTWIPTDHAERFRAAIPDARVAWLDGAGHNSMVDRPDQFNRVVLDFLTEESETA